MLRSIRRLNPRLFLMATPWSAPAWMKSPAVLEGGTLRAAMMPAYATYLLRAVQSYTSERVPLDVLSVQNEPDHEPTDYPGMRLSSRQRAQLIGQFVGPLFEQHGERVQLVEWDHNWDRPEAPLAVLADSAARRYVRGVAWHCYAGDVSAQSVVHDKYPDVATYFTECSGGSWAPNWGDNFLWNVRTLLIGATRNWASSVMLWNLALDEEHGPHLGGCTDCRGVVSIVSDAGDVVRNEEYFALAHASRFVRRDAVRIGSSGAPRLAHVAFRNADDGSIVIVVENPDQTAAPLQITGVTAPITVRLPPRSVATLVIPRR
jgi:glucosylceramidase